MPSRALATTGITFRPFATARPTAKRGVQGQLTALSKLDLQPNMAPTCKMVLGKIAQGEIIFPVSLLPTALETIGNLKDHDKVGIFAQAAFTVVAVETLIQARDHQTLHDITIPTLDAVKTGTLQIMPELADEAADAIGALIAVDALETFAAPALEVLRPTPAVPVISTPMQDLGTLKEEAPAEEEPFVPQLFEKVTLPLSPPATSNEQLATIQPFTLKVANGNGGKAYAYYTYPDTDYRPFLEEGICFSDLDEMVLDRKNLETSLGTMWCALSALGSRKGHVTRWLKEINQLTQGVSVDYTQKIEVLRQAQDLTIGFFVEAHQAKADRDSKIAEIENPNQKENETPVDFAKRIITQDEQRTQTNKTYFEKVTQLQTSFETQLNELASESDVARILHLQTPENTKNYFGNLTTQLQREHNAKITEIEEQRNKTGLIAELIDIEKKRKMVNSHRRPALVQLENLRQLSAKLRQRIVPSLDQLEAPLNPPKEALAEAMKDGIFRNWPRPAIAGVPNQAEISRLTTRINQLEAKLAEARQIADHIVGTSASNDQFTVIENGTKYSVGDKVNGGEVRFVYQWEGRNLAIVVSPVPMQTPAEIEKELRETKDQLAALEREHEAALQRVAALSQATEQPEHQKDAVVFTQGTPRTEKDLFSSLVASLKLHEFKAGQILLDIERILDEPTRTKILQLALQLSGKGIDPQDFVGVASVFEWSAEQYKNIIYIATLIIKTLPDSLINNSLKVIQYYRNVSCGAPFMLDLFYQNIIDLIESGQDPYDVIFGAMIRSFIRLPDKYKDELRNLLKEGKPFSSEFEDLIRQQFNLPKNQSEGDQ